MNQSFSPNEHFSVIAMIPIFCHIVSNFTNQSVSSTSSTKPCLKFSGKQKKHQLNIRQNRHVPSRSRKMKMF